MTDAAELETTEVAPNSTKRRRFWSKTLTPAEIIAVINQYEGGSNTRELCEQYNISRSTLYRWVEEYHKLPKKSDDLTYLKVEVAKLKELVVELALENKQLRGGEDGPDGLCAASGDASGGGDTGRDGAEIPASEG